jgi:lysophospholipid acyltransferase (LPLAT)-like uncharacterized protein
MSFKDFINAYIVPPVVSVLIRLISVTLRVTVVGAEHEAKILADGRPRILSFWHGRLFYLPHHYRKSAGDWEILVSPSGDGEIIARTLATFGFGIVRGSSFKSATKALMALRRHVEEGKSAVLIADGSRGPREALQPGALMVSKLAGGAPTLPITTAFSKQWTLKTWDKLAIPKPFAAAVVVYGEPVVCPKDADSEQLEAARAKLEAELHRITRLAEETAARA